MDTQAANIQHAERPRMDTQAADKQHVECLGILGPPVQLPFCSLISYLDVDVRAVGRQSCEL